MDMRKETQPIVKAKPVRGREMQSTRIPKDVVDTGRGVSAKQIVEPREGDVETYHEGYVDGKLYLVPDTNLQAMRDIVNLRMRRRHSSAEKPRTSLDEPTQYTEFKSKIDVLLEKIDQLADSTDDELSNQDLKEKKRKVSLKNKTSIPSTLLSKERDFKADIQNLPLTEEESQRNETVKPRSSICDKTEALPKRVAVSPMFDENIKYIRVNKTPDGLLIKSDNLSSQPYKIGAKDKIENPLKDMPKEFEPETFKLLISGHLRNGTNPIFIAHQNYTGINVLANHTPDFKTHKKDRNIDIYIKGKFFTENILIEESSESPALLDIKPNKIVIDKENALYRKKFKDIYKVGSVEVVLEGEFKKDGKSLKYTPIFSLNIIKNSLQHEYPYSGNQSPTTVLFSEENDETPFKNKNQRIENEESTQSMRKHVHYAGENEKEVCKDVHSRETPISKNGTLFSRIKKIKLYKKKYLNKDDLLSKDMSSEGVAKETSSQQMKARSSKIKREELARLRKMHLRERKARREQLRKSYNKLPEGFDSSKLRANIQVFQAKQETQSPFDPKGSLVDKDLDTIQDNVTNTKVKRVRKKEDKNKAIVENPILAQMQQFFIA